MDLLVSIKFSKLYAAFFTEEGEYLLKVLSFYLKHQVSVGEVISDNSKSIPDVLSEVKHDCHILIITGLDTHGISADKMSWGN